jgi:hypothetical protein
VTRAVRDPADEYTTDGHHCLERACRILAVATC